jgi:hypothetical protein
MGICGKNVISLERYIEIFIENILHVEKIYYTNLYVALD